MRQNVRQILKENKDAALITGRLNVDDFVAGRKADIAQLERAMAASSCSGKRRAHQLMPRTLRRRTASHNPRRVIKRLRDRARVENEEGNAQPKKRRRIAGVKDADTHKNDGDPTDGTAFNKLAELPTGGRFCKRQRNKVWLPTHVWHKKRAHVEVLWQFCVPITPSQKQYRPTHRIGHELVGAMVWDRSYLGTMVVSGSANAVSMAAKLFPNFDVNIYRSGKRSWQGEIPSIGPALCYWLPDSSFVVNAHPEVFMHVWLQINGIPEILLEDCRFAIGCVELYGAKSLSTLIACLRPYDCEQPEAKLWNELGPVGSVGSLPMQSVLHLETNDPRLSYPPNRQRPKGTIDRALKMLTGEWPRPGCVPSLFRFEERLKSVKAQASQAELDKRKPCGKHIERVPTDPKIPVSIFALNNGKIRVLLPWKWVLPLWLSITHMPNILIGGFREYQQLAYERGECSFPKDYPLTPAGMLYAHNVAQTNRAKNDSRPPGIKRDYSREIGDPYGFQWNLITGDVFPVQLKMVHRGTPKDLARIYSIPEHDAVKWSKVLDNPHAEVPACPGQEHLIGFVTSGNYNMSEALGTAIGSATRTAGLCLVRNVGSDVARLAKLSNATTGVS